MAVAAVQAPPASVITCDPVAAGRDRSWVLRGANFVVVYSQMTAGARLSRAEQIDEYFAFLPDAPGHLITGSGTTEIPASALAIVEPGDSTLVAGESGTVVRVFTSRSRDLCDSSLNADCYETPPAAVMPMAARPMTGPDDLPGTRVYSLADHPAAEGAFRVFRTAELMLNLFPTRHTRRDPAALSPHWHEDFEQCSVTLDGTWTHHLRYPWVPNIDHWRPDERWRCESPSLTVIPAGVEHTSQDHGEGPTTLIDVFAPPRLDLIDRGVVINQTEYDHLVVEVPPRPETAR